MEAVKQKADDKLDAFVSVSVDSSSNLTEKT